jgi:hypothetical protein
VRDELLGILALLPAILEEYDTIRVSEENLSQAELNRLQHLVTRCWTVDRDLQEWSRRFVHQLTGMLSPAELQSMLDAYTVAPGSFTPESLSKTGIDVLYTTLLYWTICLTLYDFLRTAIKVLSQDTLNVAQPQIPQRAHPRHCAVNISKATAHFLQFDGGLFAGQVIAYPIGVALQYFAVTGEEVEEELKEFVKTMRYLSTLPSYSWIDKFLRSLGDNYASRGVSPSIDPKVFVSSA